MSPNKNSSNINLSRKINDEISHMNTAGFHFWFFYPHVFQYVQNFKIFKFPPWYSNFLYIFKVSPLCMSIEKWQKSREIKLLLQSILEQCGTGWLLPWLSNLPTYLFSFCRRVCSLLTVNQKHVHMVKDLSQNLRTVNSI